MITVNGKEYEGGLEQFLLDWYEECSKYAAENDSRIPVYSEETGEILGYLTPLGPQEGTPIDEVVISIQMSCDIVQD